MGLAIAIDAAAVLILWVVAARRGVESALPWGAFFLMIVPGESQIPLPGLFDLTTQRVVVIALLAAFLFGRGARSGAHSEAGRQLPLRWCLLSLVVWWAIAAANSVVPIISIKTVLSQIFDFCVIYYIFAKTITRKETVNAVLYALVLAMLVCSAFGAVEAYTGWQVISLFPPTTYRFGSLVSLADRGIRVQSTFSHTILYGAALAMVIPVALYLMSRAQTRGRRIVLWVALLLMFLNIYKTGSRGPWIACLLSCGLLLVFSGPVLKRRMLIVVAITCLVLVVRPGVWNSIADLYGETLNPDTAQGESYQWRYVLLDVAKRELTRSVPRAVWGYGPESFYYLGITTEFEGHIVKVDSCDSSLVAIMVETGYVGLIIAGWLFLRAACIMVRNLLNAERSDRDIHLIALAALGVFCFMMTNVAILGWGQQSYLLWIMMAMALVYPYTVKTSEQSDDVMADDNLQGAAEEVTFVPRYGLP